MLLPSCGGPLFRTGKGLFPPTSAMIFSPSFFSPLEDSSIVRNLDPLPPYQNSPAAPFHLKIHGPYFSCSFFLLDPLYTHPNVPLLHLFFRFFFLLRDWSPPNKRRRLPARRGLGFSLSALATSHIRFYDSNTLECWQRIFFFVIFFPGVPEEEGWLYISPHGGFRFISTVIGPAAPALKPI